MSNEQTIADNVKILREAHAAGEWERAAIHGTRAIDAMVALDEPIDFTAELRPLVIDSVNKMIEQRGY